MYFVLRHFEPIEKSIVVKIATDHVNGIKQFVESGAIMGTPYRSVPTVRGGRLAAQPMSDRISPCSGTRTS